VAETEGRGSALEHGIQAAPRRPLGEQTRRRSPRRDAKAEKSKEPRTREATSRGDKGLLLTATSVNAGRAGYVYPGAPVLTQCMGSIPTTSYPGSLYPTGVVGKMPW